MTKAAPEVLVSAEAIAERIDVLCAQMAPRLSNDTIVVGLLQGAFIFMADVMRGLSRQGLSPKTDFLWLSSYGDSREPGRLNILADLQKSVRGAQVLVVDDVYDTGNTIRFATDYLVAKGAVQVLTCLLARKPAAEGLPAPDYLGFDLPDRFLVGYGLDDAGYGRGIPELRALD
jgi:hypoxanthine phosphoribosyltransferase